MRHVWLGPLCLRHLCGSPSCDRRLRGVHVPEVYGVAGLTPELKAKVRRSTLTAVNTYFASALVSIVRAQHDGTPATSLGDAWLRTRLWRNVLVRKSSMSSEAVSMHRGYHEDEFCSKRRPHMTTPLRPAPPNVKALEDKAAVGGMRRPRVSIGKTGPSDCGTAGSPNPVHVFESCTWSPKLLFERHWNGSTRPQHRRGCAAFCAEGACTFVWWGVCRSCGCG